MSKKETYDYSMFDKGEAPPLAPAQTEEPSPSPTDNGEKAAGYDYSMFEPEKVAPKAEVPYWKTVLASGASFPGFNQAGHAISTFLDPHHIANLATGKESMSDVIGEYQKARDASSKQIHEAKDANPKTAFAGDLATGMLVPAGAAINIPKNASLLAKLAGIIGTGGIWGAASGASDGKADMAEATKNLINNEPGKALDQVKQLGTDVKEGAESGMVTAPFIHAGAKTVGGLAKMALGSKVGKAFKWGAKGENLSDQPTHAEELTNATKDLAENTLDSRKNISLVDYEQAKAALETSNLDTNLKTAYQKMLDNAAKLERGSKPGEAAFEDAQKMKKFVLERSQGPEVEHPIMASHYTPEEDVSAEGLTKVKAKLAQIVDDLEQQGVKVTTKVEPVTLPDGSKKIRGTYSYDEPVGAPEKVNTPEVPEPVGPKVKASYPDNSNENIAKAKARIAQLQSKAALEQSGKVYEMHQDNHNGVVHVVEHQGGGPFPPAPPSLEPGNSESLYNTLTRNVYEPATIPAHGGEEYQAGTHTVREGGSDVVPLKELPSLKTAAAGQKDVMSTKEGENAFSQLVGEINDVMGSAGQPGQQYRRAEGKYSAVMEAMKMLGIKQSDMVLNRETGKQELGPDALRHVRNMLRQLGASGTSSQDNAQNTMKAVLDQLSLANPELASRVGPRVQDASEKFDLSRIINAEKPFHTHPINMVKGEAVRGANVTGLVTREVGGLAKDIALMGPRGLDALANKLSMQTSFEAGTQKTAQAVANIFREAASRDDVGRNALIFSLLQNPGYREFINKHLPNVGLSDNK